MTDISVENESGVACDLDSLRDLAAFVMTALRLHDDTEVAISLVDEPRMTELHLEWMDEPGPTDVLSFPMDELRVPGDDEEPDPGMLGDIVLCPSFAAVQAAERGRDLDGELQFLVVHGMLHLLGHDHATQEEYDRMFAMQDELLAAWLASRPA